MCSKFSFISITSRNITYGGMGFGFNSIYTNVNGAERGMASIHPLLPQRHFLDKTLDEEISNYKTNYQKNFNTLGNIHRRNLQRTQSQFFDIKKLLEKKKNENNNKMDKLRLQKEKELKELEKSEYNLDATNLNDTYMGIESRKINQNFEKMRNNIDKKYQFTKPKLEMEENDKETMDNYIKNIKRLNTFSNAPNFKKIINEFKLNNYI